MLFHYDVTNTAFGLECDLALPGTCHMFLDDFLFSLLPSSVDKEKDFFTARKEGEVVQAAECRDNATHGCTIVCDQQCTCQTGTLLDINAVELSGLACPLIQAFEPIVFQGGGLEPKEQLRITCTQHEALCTLDVNAFAGQFVSTGTLKGNVWTARNATTDFLNLVDCMNPESDDCLITCHPSCQCGVGANDYATPCLPGTPRPTSMPSLTPSVAPTTSAATTIAATRYPCSRTLHGWRMTTYLVLLFVVVVGTTGASSWMME